MLNFTQFYIFYHLCCVQNECQQRFIFIFIIIIIYLIFNVKTACLELVILELQCLERGEKLFERCYMVSQNSDCSYKYKMLYVILLTPACFVKQVATLVFTIMCYRNNIMQICYITFYQNIIRVRLDNDQNSLIYIILILT